MRELLKKISMMVVAFVAAVGMMLPADKVFASSAYDDTINPLSDLLYNDESEDTYSIAGTWRTKLRDACGATIYNDFHEALNGGRYAVTQEGTDDDFGVTVIWSKAGEVTSTFFDVAWGTTTYVATNPGMQGKARFYFNSTIDEDVCSYSTVAFNNTYGNTLDVEGDGAHLGVYISTFSRSYVSGYDGSEFPVPASITPISGQIECFNNDTQVSFVHITPDVGVGGEAILTGSGQTYTYIYYPSEEGGSTYEMEVDCGGVIQGTNPSNPSMSTWYVWYCSVAVMQDCYPQ